MKRKKTFYILRYIFAVVLIIGGLGNLSSSVPFGLCVTLAGVSLFPFIWNLIRKKAAIARCQHLPGVRRLEPVCP